MVINWKEGKVMLKQVNAIKKGNERGMNASVLSFFNWFDISDDEMYVFDEIAKIIKVHIWPNPLKNINCQKPFKKMKFGIWRTTTMKMT
jgi:hypothetical protein